MASKDRAESVFKLSDGARKFSRLDLGKNNPELGALVSKLVTDPTRRVGSQQDGRNISIPSNSFLQKISDITSTNVNDAESLFQLLPDTELSMQIYISSILSPKDMMSTDLTYSVELGSVEPEMVAAMIAVVEHHFDKVYKIKKILPRILEDVMFKTGSYPLLVLPENTVDDAINSPYRVSMESMNDVLDREGHVRPMGFLGYGRQGDIELPQRINKDSLAMESLASAYSHTSTMEVSMEKMAITKGFDPHISVSDNFSILKMPLLRDKLRQDRIQDILSMHKVGMKPTREGMLPKVSMEAASDRGKKRDIANTAQLEASLYKKRRYKNVQAFSLAPGDSLSRPAVGHPLIMKLPCESVIPVHVPSNPEEHLGYFIMIDNLGNPVTKSAVTDFYTDLTANINANQQMVSQLIATTKRSEQGRETNRQVDETEALKAYGDLVEEDLLTRLRSGIYGNDVQIARPTEVYRVMFARALNQMHTRLLYVPAELMTYIAFDYNQYGIGKSLLEKNRILGSIRAMLLFAGTMAAVKNSVARTNLNITLDPNDPDPSKTVEFMIHEYAKTTQSSYPLGASNPLDIVSFLQNSARQVTVQGNTAYPETKLEIEDKTSSRAKPDTELTEELKNQFIMGLGLSPEVVNMGANAEFATTVVNSNILLSKRVLHCQDLLTGFVQDHIQKVTLYSGTLMDQLREVAKRMKRKGKKAKVKDGAETEVIDDNPLNTAAPSDDAELDRIVVEFIHALTVTLPAPDTVKIENQYKAFQAYDEALSATLKAYVDASFLDMTTMGSLGEKTEVIYNVLRSYFLRQWLRSNNVLPELEILTNIGNENNEDFNLFDAQESHLEGLQKTIGKFVEFLRKKLEARGLTAENGYAEPTPNAASGGGGFDVNGGYPGFDDPDLAGDDKNAEVAAAAKDGDSEGADNREDAEELEATESGKKPAIDGDDVAV